MTCKLWQRIGEGGAAIALLLFTGCAGKEVELEDPSEYRVTVGSEALYTEPSQFEESLGLHARRSGTTLLISARNERRDEVHIIPQDLALLVPVRSPGAGRDRELVRITPANAAVEATSPLMLGPGDRGILQIAMREPALLYNARLVYNNPRNEILFYVEVEE